MTTERARLIKQLSQLLRGGFTGASDLTTIYELGDKLDILFRNCPLSLIAMKVGVLENEVYEYEKAQDEKAGK